MNINGPAELQDGAFRLAPLGSAAILGFRSLGAARSILVSPMVALVDGDNAGGGSCSLTSRISGLSMTASSTDEATTLVELWSKPTLLSGGEPLGANSCPASAFPARPTPDRAWTPENPPSLRRVASAPVKSSHKFRRPTIEVSSLLAAFRPKRYMSAMTVPARVKTGRHPRVLREARKIGAKQVKVGPDGAIDILISDGDMADRWPRTSSSRGRSGFAYTPRRGWISDASSTQAVRAAAGHSAR